MSIKINRIVKGMKEAIKSDKRTTTPYDTVAKVVKVEDGIAWVHIDGGVDQTPVKISASVKVGDEVQVRISGGQAWAYGNYTAPPTDDSTANKAVEEVTLTNKAVKKVREIVNTVSKIAGDTAQYFWHIQQGTDTGVHITEIPKEDFLADPENGGGNLLARSNGIAVRDGLTELAQFGAGLARVGQEDDSNVEITEESVKMYKDGLECVSFELPSEAKTRVGGRARPQYSGTVINVGSSYSIGSDSNLPQYDFAEYYLEYQGTEYKLELSSQGSYDASDPSTYYYCQKSGSVFTAYGNGARTLTEDETLYARVFRQTYSAPSYVGCYPKKDDSRPIMFAVGNGTPATPSNAFDVDWFGNVRAKGKVQTTGIANLVHIESVRVYGNNSAGTYKYQDLPTVSGYAPIGIIGLGAYGQQACVLNLYEWRLVSNQVRVAWSTAIPTTSAVDIEVLYLLES